MILLDSSVLIDALTGPRRSEPSLRFVVEQGIRMRVPSLVLYEWRRGPRTNQELAVQEELFPAEEAVPFGTKESLIAGDLFKRVARPWGREVDIAIAACAIALDADLWAQNHRDFADLPGLRLYVPSLEDGGLRTRIR